MHSSGERRTGVRGREDQPRVSAPAVRRAGPGDGHGQLGTVADAEAVEQRGHERVDAPTVVELGQDGPDGLTHDAGRTALVAEHPAPAAGGDQLTLTVPGHRDRSGAGDQADAVGHAHRQRHQLGVVDHPRPDRSRGRRARAPSCRHCSVLSQPCAPSPTGRPQRRRTPLSPDQSGQRAGVRARVAAAPLGGRHDQVGLDDAVGREGEPGLGATEVDADDAAGERAGHRSSDGSSDASSASRATSRATQTRRTHRLRCDRPAERSEG